MSTTASSSKTGRPRGRRAAARVPCDACIARASGNKQEGAAIELCARCTAVLHRPRNKKPEPLISKRMRRRSSEVTDTTFGINSPPAFDTPWSNGQQEQHSFQFFITYSAPQLAGYLDSPFWQRMVLRAGQHEPAVRHAMVAIGALHERLLSGTLEFESSEDHRTSFALEQCNRSIQSLVRPANGESNPDIQLMLTTSVLYTCFEALQGHCEQAIMHATQAYNLLQQYNMDPGTRRWDVGAFAVELDQLCLLIRRRQTPSNTDTTSHPLPDLHLIGPTNLSPSFHSLAEARSALEQVSSRLTTLLLDMELDDHSYRMAVSGAEKHVLYTPWLSEWEEAFSTFLSQNHGLLSTAERAMAMVLKAHHLVAEILAGIDLSLLEMAWNSFHNQFSAIVNLATAVIRDCDEGGCSANEPRWNAEDASNSTTFSISLGVIDPLFEVCARCRDPALRRRALQLLANHPRQDRVWTSAHVWKAGMLLLQGEEDDTGQARHDFNSSPGRQSVVGGLLAVTETVPQYTPSNSLGAYNNLISRTIPRPALNPGLFQNPSTPRTTTAACFENEEATGCHDSKVPSTSASLTPESGVSAPAATVAVATAAGPSDGYDTPDWIDYDGFQPGFDIPSILETPPEG